MIKLKFKHDIQFLFINIIRKIRMTNKLKMIVFQKMQAINSTTRTRMQMFKYDFPLHTFET